MRRCLLVLAVLGLLVGACGPGGGASAPAPAGGAALPAQAAASSGTQTAPAPGGATPPAPAAPLRHVTIGVTAPSLSFLPAKLADLLGYYTEEGLDPEFVVVSGTSIIPSLMSGDLDLTTLLTPVGAHAAQGGPTRIVQYHSVRVQHVITVRPDVTTVQQLAGRRVAVQSMSTLTAFEVRRVAEHFGLADVTLLAVGGELERIAAIEAGAADATALAVPSNLVAEQRGLATLLRVGEVLPIPQAGLATSLSALHDRTDLVTRVIRGAARALPVIGSQRALVEQKIAEWVELSPAEAARAYDLVADTYTPNGLPTDAQLAAFLDLLRATAGAPDDVKPDDVADFTIARRVAAELDLPSQ
ncbi:MAG TPA: ABC transporter substrate-binding protein [Chloroflexota bacterium]